MISLSQFQDHRAQIAHTLLENGVFYRLGASRTLLESDESLKQRVEKLIEIGLAVASEHKNFRRAASTWLDGDSGLRSVREEIDALLTEAKDVEGLAPGRSFPVKTDLIKHIEVCSEKFRGCDYYISGLRETKVIWLREFWPNALVVFDTVQSFRKGSPYFWDFMCSKKL